MKKRRKFLVPIMVVLGILKIDILFVIGIVAILYWILRLAFCQLKKLHAKKCMKKIRQLMEEDGYTEEQAREKLKDIRI